MKYLSTVLLCFLLNFAFAQNTISNISNIQPISQLEFNAIQSPKDGDIVLVKETSAIMYYINNTWYAMTGECTPRPNTPKIDSVTTTENSVLVYFTPIEDKQQYFIQILDTEIKTTVSKSPAKLPLPEKKSNYILQLQAISPCGKAGPTSTTLSIK